MKKKLVSLLSLILVAVMVLPMMPVAVYAADSNNNGYEDPEINATYVSGSGDKVYNKGDYNTVQLELDIAEAERPFANTIVWTVVPSDAGRITTNGSSNPTTAVFTASKAVEEATISAVIAFGGSHPYDFTASTSFEIKSAVELEVPAESNASYKENTFYHDSVYPSLTMKATGGDGSYYSWGTANPDKVTVSGNGSTATITPVANFNGTVTITVQSDGAEDSFDVSFAPRTCTGISVTTLPTKLSYIETDIFDPAGMVVKATYNDGQTLPINDYTIDITPKTTNGGLAYNSVVKVKYANHNAVIDAVTVGNRFVERVSFTPAGKYYVGDDIPAFEVNIKRNNDTAEKTIVSGYDVYINNEKVDLTTRKFKATDEKIKVVYEGVSSQDYTIKVEAKPTETEKPTETPSTSTITYTIEMTDAPTKKSYKVGEIFDDTGMKVKVTRKETSSSGNSLETNYTSKVSGLTYTAYTIKETDAGKDYIEFEVSFNADGATHKATLKVTGLTIGNVVDTTRIAEITSVTLKEDKYPEGYEFDLTDIEKMKVRFYGDRTATTIEDDEFADYEYISSSYMTLEVYDSDGERKAYSTYRDTIRDDDIITETDGDKIVNMALRYTYFSSSSSTAKGKDGEYKFTTEIGEADVSYYYDNELIAEYEDLDEALEFCNEQDEDIDEDIFDISDVDDNDYILLKLGKSFTLSSSFDFTPENNIVIDLNGHNLTLDSDAFEFDKDEDFTITIRNTSKTDSKLTFDDKDIEIVLQEDEKVEFEYGKALPGIYTVTASFNADEGTVTADPKLSTGKVEVGKGSTVKFTVTPKADYAVDTVKVGTKSVVGEKDTYSVNSTTGVVTYTLKNVSKDTTFSVTFKKVKKEWNNPFRDVSSNADYYTAVEFVYENELFKGTTNTTFSPSGSMTRATFVTVLGRLSGMDDNEAVRKYGYDSDFTDVSASNSRITYAVPYIKWAVENGIVEGYGDGTFGPEREITHQQMYVMMYRYARFVENKSDSIQYTSLSMSDRSSVAEWAVDAVKYAQKNDYLVFTNTTQTKIDPTGAAKRSELAMLLETFCETVLGWSGDEK